MLIEYALGIAGRSAGIAEADRLPLVTVHPSVISVLGIDPAAETILVRIRVEADVVLDRRPFRFHALDDRRESAIVK